MDELIEGKCRVSWTELGEGWQGDYNPDDPDDVELLRFDIDFFSDDIGEWECVDGGSYCTQVPVTATPEERERGLRIIMDYVKDKVEGDSSIRRVSAWLSWMHIGELQP